MEENVKKIVYKTFGFKSLKNLKNPIEKYEIQQYF